MHYSILSFLSLHFTFFFFEGFCIAVFYCAFLLPLVHKEILFFLSISFQKHYLKNVLASLFFLVPLSISCVVYVHMTHLDLLSLPAQASLTFLYKQDGACRSIAFIGFILPSDIFCM